MTTPISMRLTVVFALCTTLSGIGHAQPQGTASPREDFSVRAPSSTDESYGVIFEDDPMFALGPDTIIPRLSVRRGEPRTRLLRARTSFVPELLKSVETF